MSDNWTRINAEAKLISLPDIYWRLKELLSSHDYAMPDVASLISHDPGLTARLLRLVNSAYFGFAATIETVNHAVSILGVQQIEDLVLTTSVADALGDYQCEQLDVEAFWRKSVYRAIAARKLAAECNVMDAERLFVGGLLCGVGHLIMYQSVPVLAQQAAREAREKGYALHHVEQDVLGFDHSMVAATLLKNWKLPPSLVAMVSNHLEPRLETEFPLESGLVHIAERFAHAFDAGEPLDECLVVVNPHAWDISGLDMDTCLALEPAIAEQLAEVLAMLFPKLKRTAKTA